MKNKKRLLILAGTLVTMVLIGAGWYAIFSHANDNQSIDSMEGMAGMDRETFSDQDQSAAIISPSRRQLIGVKTAVAEKQILESIIHTVGTVDYDERRIRQINLRTSGWITKIFADYTGKSVKKGDPLFSLYSPDAVAAEQEYLLAYHTLEQVRESPFAHIQTGVSAQATSARSRLLLLNLTEAQIHALETRGQSQTEIVIHSPTDGMITKKMALEGMYATPEMNLYEITDLSTLWVYTHVYEYELSRVEVGQDAEITLAAYPGKIFVGKIVHIYPYLDKDTRTVKVRIELTNPDGKLKPNMYGEVKIKTGGREALAIPEEAVLNSGTRTLIFIDKGSGIYEPREVKLGNKIGQYYPVLDGLEVGQRIVTSATFLIDSESKLMAATNMMGMLGMGGTKMETAQMGEMEMSGMPMGDMKGMEGMQGMKEMKEMKEMKVDPSPASTREQTVSGLTLAFSTEPDPPKKGQNRIRLSLRAKGTPVIGANVTLAYTMAMPGMDIETVTATHVKEGIYEADISFPMRGTWEIEAAVTRGAGKPVKAKFTVTVG